MKSRTTKRFRDSLFILPQHIQESAKNAFLQWKKDPMHPGLQFKKIHHHKPIYSVRIRLGYRALGNKENEKMIWFWIGTHSEYDKLISELR